MDHKGTVRLETERLVLRRLTEADAEAMFNNWANDPEVTKYLTWPTHRNVDMSRGYLAWCAKECEKNETYQWGIVLKESDEPIGNISVVGRSDEIDALELGWVIGRRWWGNGYTAEAAKEVIRFLFTEVGANRIGAGHDTNNPNSGKVMRKAGMKYEGILRQSGRNNCGIVDCAWYSILRSEWQEEPT